MPQESNELSAIRQIQEAASGGAYENAEALALDIDAALADLPLSISKDTAFSKTNRWLRHHPRAFGITVATLLFAFISMAASLVAISFHNKKISRSNHALTAEKEKVVLERDRAERNLKVAATSVDSFYLAFSRDSALRHPKFDSIRELFNTNALQAFQVLAKTNPRNDDTSSLVANSKLCLAQMDLEKNDVESAEKWCKDALDMLNSSPANDENSNTTLNGIALAHSLLVVVYLQIEGDIEYHIDEATRLYAELEETNTSTHIKSGFVNLLSNSSIYYRTIDDNAKALESRKKAVDLSRQLALLHVEDIDVQMTLANAIRQYSDLLSKESGDEQERLYEESVKIFDRVLKHDPENVEARLEKAMTCHNRAVRLDWQTFSVLAERNYQQAIEMISELATRCPDRSIYSYHHANFLLSFALFKKNVEPFGGDYEVLLSRALTIATELHLSDSVTLRSELLYATCLAESGALSNRSNARKDAEENYSKAIAVLQAFPAKQRQASDGCALLRWAFNGRAIARIKKTKPDIDGAHDDFDQAISISGGKEKSKLMLLKAKLYVQKGDPENASELARQLNQVEPFSETSFIDIAELWSACTYFAKRKGQEVAAIEYESAACETLWRGHHANVFANEEARKLVSHRVFGPIRNNPQYKALLEELERL